MRKLLNAEQQQIFAYIADEPEYTLFIYGDIKNCGLEGDKVEAFAKDGENGYEYIIVRYDDNFMVYSKNDSYNVAEAVQFLKTQKVANLNGKGSIILPIAQYYPNKKCTITYLTRASKPVKASTSIKVQLLNADNAEEIYNVLNQIEEFEVYQAKKKESVINELKESLNKSSHAFGVYENGTLCTLAKTTAETETSAMVVGVATLPNYRGKGYAVACVNEMINFCLEGLGMKYICLFYDNPVAGRIYHKAGFEDLGEYVLINEVP